MNFVCETGHPSFVMLYSFTNKLIAKLELWKEREIGKYEKKVYPCMCYPSTWTKR